MQVYTRTQDELDEDVEVTRVQSPAPQPMNTQQAPQQLFRESRASQAPQPNPIAQGQSAPVQAPNVTVTPILKDYKPWSVTAEEKLRGEQTAYETEKLRQDILSVLITLSHDQLVRVKSRLDATRH